MELCEHPDRPLPSVVGSDLREELIAAGVIRPGPGCAPGDFVLRRIAVPAGTPILRLDDTAKILSAARIAGRKTRFERRVPSTLSQVDEQPAQPERRRFDSAWSRGAT